MAQQGLLPTGGCFSDTEGKMAPGATRKFVREVRIQERASNLRSQREIEGALLTYPPA